MSLVSTIDVNRDGLVAASSTDNVISVFELEAFEPLAVCPLPQRLGSVRRLKWAFQTAKDGLPNTFYIFVSDCEHGFAVFDLVRANFAELRLRHACPLPSTPHSEWLDLVNDPPALAVTLDIPSVTFIWSTVDNVASFTLPRGRLQPSVFEGQYFIHWKRLQTIKDSLTLWPTRLSCEFPVDAPALVTCCRYSPLFVYSDALAGGLYVGAIHNRNIVSLPDIRPVKLGWLNTGHIACLAEPTLRTPYRRLVLYDEALSEVFSFMDATLQGNIQIDQLVLHGDGNASYKLVSGIRKSELRLFNESTDFIVSNCGSYIAVKSTCAVTIWDVSTATIPKLIRVFDYRKIPGFRFIWATFKGPMLIVFSNETLYLSIYRCYRDPKIISIDSCNISSMVLTESGDLVVCSANSYQYINIKSLWSLDPDEIDTYETHAMRHHAMCMKSLKLHTGGLFPETAKCFTVAKYPTLKRGYADMNEET